MNNRRIFFKMYKMIQQTLTILTFIFILINGNQFEFDNYEDIFTTPNLASDKVKSSVFFDRRYSHNITTIAGQSAFLNCRVRNIGKKTVSWVRHRDINLLTVGKYTYSSDERFVPLHNDETGDWTLQIKFSNRKDSGPYECQVSTTPPMGLVIHLSVVEPNTTIVGGPDLFINTGSTVNLTCIISQSPEPPQLIKWTHNNEEINYDSPRGGVSVITEKGETTTSYLLIQKAKKRDSGKYSCTPSNANPYSVTVHILNGENPAAMHHSNESHSSHLSPFIPTTISSFFSMLLCIKYYH